jgi:hypothetical protein
MFESNEEYFVALSNEEGKQATDHFTNQFKEVPEIASPFTSREREKLKQVLTNTKPKVWDFTFPQDFPYILRIEGRSDMVIWKLQDDWFIVKVKHYNTSQIVGFNRAINEYYKCDQFEGLLKLLQHLEYIS